MITMIRKTMLAVSLALMLLMMLFIMMNAQDTEAKLPAGDTAGAGDAAALTASSVYTQPLHNLQSYFANTCGPPPDSPRSCDWGVYHEYSGIAHRAMVTGSTTSETENLMLAFEALYDRRYDDGGGGFDGVYAYIRDHMLPHDGWNDPPHDYQGSSPPYFPCLTHWLIDVDGGTKMGDTGTVVGPNTPYLPYEYHPSEDPPDPAPDREAYVSATDYKYASATDADQWLADGLFLASLLRGRAEYADLAHCIVDSLRDGLTTASDFRYSLIDDFEKNDLAEWWSYEGSGAEIITGTVAPGAEDTDYTLAFTYTVPSSGFAGVGKSIAQDWRAFEGVQFRFKGQGGGEQVRVVLTDPAPDAAPEALEREYFQAIVADTDTAWRLVQLPFTAFEERPDWPPDAAKTGNNQLDLEAIQSLAFEPLPATFADDFEDGEGQGWWTTAISGSVMITDVVSPGAGNSGYALQTTYDIAEGLAGLGATPQADWSSFEMLAFDLQGAGSGNLIRVELVEFSDERWAHILVDDTAGWRFVEIPLEMSAAGFSKRPWQPKGANENDVLDLDNIKDIILSPLPGWFRDDFEDENIEDWWRYDQTQGSVFSSEVITPGANGTLAAMRLSFDVEVGGWDGYGKNVGLDWRDYLGVRLWLRGASGGIRLLITDADDETFAYTPPNLPASWTHVEIPWADFAYRTGNGNRELDRDHIQAFIVEPRGPGLTVVDLDQLTVYNDDLGQGFFRLDNVGLTGDGVRSGQGTAWVDQIELMGDPGLPVYPNVMKFSLQWNQDRKDPWEGPLYTGYQDPATWCLVGDSDTASDIVNFLADAQIAYSQTISGTPAFGPFMPLFAQEHRYSGSNAVGWTWDGSKADENTDWAQFQYRTFAHLGHYYFLSGDQAAEAVLDGFHSWLTGMWEKEGDHIISLPITMTAGTGQIGLGYRPGDFGLAAQGLIYLAARTGDSAYRADAEALLSALVRQQDDLGAFPNNVYRFGFEQAEVGIALALHDLLLGEAGIDPVFAFLMGDGCQQRQIHVIQLPLIFGDHK